MWFDDKPQNAQHAEMLDSTLSSGYISIILFHYLPDEAMRESIIDFPLIIIEPSSERLISGQVACASNPGFT